MKAYLSRRYRLSASHRLFNDGYSDEQNFAVFGKCANPHGHGHNYVVEVTVGGPVDEATGMVCDLGVLDSCVREEVVDRFDHTNLNLSESFRQRVPTTENFCITIYDLLASAFRAAELVRVRIDETNNNSFEYAGKR
jgi:6-pyruvoyltetrahydropterin/6-carboxytetrahydropterin synthase